MLRHTRPILSRKWHANILFQQITLIQEFDEPKLFHEASPTCYKEAKKTDAFSPILDRYSSRYVITAPLSVGNKCKVAPFIIDTGAPITVIHEDTIGRFVNKFDVDHAKDSIGEIFIGEVPVPLRLNTDKHGTFKFLNILGLDFIDAAMPGLRGYINTNISKFQPPPIKDVFVTNGTATTAVTPEEPRVLYLKKAIKAEFPELCKGIPSYHIILRDPNNNNQVMGDTDPLHANIEYVFEVPSQRKEAASLFSFSFFKK